MQTMYIIIANVMKIAQFKLISTPAPAPAFILGSPSPAPAFIASQKPSVHLHFSASR